MPIPEIKASPKELHESLVNISRKVFVVFLVGSIVESLGANMAQVTIEPSQIARPNICEKFKMLIIYLSYKKKKDIYK
jgi:hypothetical protein